VRWLVVFCHPDPSSYNAALRDRAVAALHQGGHELREIDLYQQGFNPVLSAPEKASYLPDTAKNIAQVAEHVEALKWAEGLMVIYPTWFYGPPAMLKGWLDRVWLPGVVFEIPTHKGARAQGALRNITHFVGITTSGSPWWWLRWIGDPGRSLFMRGLKVLYQPGCSMRWLQLHNMNNLGDEARLKFLARVEREVIKSGSI
jgi:NAD(P)H dehydrogenase (quinone)